MKIKYLLAIVLLFSIRIYSQLPKIENQSLKLSGYFENRFFPQELNNEVMLQDYNKLRLNLASEFSEKITFNTNVNYITYHGTTEFNSFDFIPKNIVDDYINVVGTSSEILRPMYAFNYEDNIFLDNAYISIYTNLLNVRIGKQQLSWGTGYAWNPTDIFNTKDLLDPTYEKVGVNAFKIEVPFLNNGMLTGILSIKDNWENTTKAIKAKYYVAGFDLSAIYAEEEQSKIDYYTFNQTMKKRSMFGGDISGSIAGLGIWAEAAYNKMENRKNYGQYLAGADYTFMNGLYFMLEYYKNELGKSSENEYDFNHWMILLGPHVENLGKDYIYFGQLYPIGELVNWSNYLMVNLNDGSGMVFPWVDFSITDNTEVILVGYLPFGKSRTEYGDFGKGGFVRIRMYF